MNRAAIPRSIGRARLAAVAGLLTLLFVRGEAGTSPAPPAPQGSPPAAAAERHFYVAPDGLPTNDGTRERPLDLVTALSFSSPARPGDTILLRGGVYQGNFISRLNGTADRPIIVRQHFGERAILDGGETQHPVLSVDGSYTWFWGFEVASLAQTSRISESPFPWAFDLNRGEGIIISQRPGGGVGSRFINLVVHDTMQGFGFWKEGIDSEIYGTLIYYNGWIGSIRPHGHGIYVQNETNTRRITDNIIFSQFSHGIHAFGSEKASLDHLLISGNTLFNNGAPGGWGARNFLAGGGQPTHNLQLIRNLSYYPPAVDGSNQAGNTGPCENATIRENYLAGDSPLKFVNCSPVVMQDNVFRGDVDPENIPTLYPDNVYGQALSPGLRVFVQPNAYEPGRANITIFNWPNQAEVAVDLSSAGLPVGARYELRDAQNFFGPPVRSGTYDGAPLLVPMTGLPVAAPIGTVPYSMQHTGPEFGAFVLVRTSNAAPAALDGTASTAQDTAVQGLLRARDPDGLPVSYALVGAPANGTVTLDNPATGAFTYTPAAGFAGVDRFTFKASDGEIDSNAATVSVTVTRPPTVSAIPDVTVQEDATPFEVAFTVADAESPAADLTVSATSSNLAVLDHPVTGGAGADRTLRFTTIRDRHGSSAIAIVVSDGVATTRVTFQVIVQPVADPPVANDLALTVNEDAVVTGRLTGTDVDGDALTFRIATPPARGEAVVTNPATGEVTYTPSPNVSGADQFQVVASDGALDSPAATVTVTITPVNDPPIVSGLPDTDVVEDTTSAPVLFTIDDIDTPIDRLTVAVRSSSDTLLPPDGLRLERTGASCSLQMTPGRDQTGSATVTVTVSDDTASTTATFTATVTPVNDAPIVQPLGILTPRNRTVNAVLVASDPDNDPLTFTVSTPPANGTVDHPSQNAGAFSYTPNPGYFGPDRIEFAVRDQAAVTTGVVTVTVMRPPEIAIVADQTLEEDTTLGGLAVTVSDLETPADQLVLTATSGDLELLPAEGLALSGSGTSRALAITPAPNRFGSTRVTLLVNDGGDETPTTFMVTVLPVNDRPVAAVSQFDGVEDTQLEARLLATDVDLDALTFAIVEAPAKGTVELVDPLAGRFIYRPTQNANGQDSFTFTVTDGALVSEPAVALIQVAPVNDAPVAGRIVTVENTTVFGSLPASDIDGDVLTYSIVTQGTLGTATIVDAAAGRFSYTPNANAVGTDTLVFRVSDGTAMSDASIVIEIVPKGGGGAGGAQEGYIMPARDRTPAPPSTRRPQSHEASGRIIGS